MADPTYNLLDQPALSFDLGGSGSAFGQLPPPSLGEILELNKLRSQPQPGSSQPSLLGSGLKTGTQEALGLGGLAVEALANVVGLEGLKQSAGEFAQNRFDAAKSYSRPDLEKMPWEEGGPGYLPFFAYQAAKTVPYLGASIVAAPVAEAAAPAAVTAALGRAGSVLPKFLGGGGLVGRTAVPFAERRAAVEAGKDFGSKLLGGMAVGTPLGAGSVYDQMKEASGEEGPSRAQALGALALGVPYGALEAVGPAQTVGLFKRGLSSGNILKRVATAGVAEGIQEGVTEATQSAIEMSVRPDLPAAEKFKNITDSFLVGAGVGGIIGGPVGGIRRLRDTNPSQVSTKDLAQNIDAELNFGPPTNNAQQLDLALPETVQPPQQPAQTIAQIAQPQEQPAQPQEQQLDLGLPEQAPYQTSMAEVPPQDFSKEFLRGANTESIANYIAQKEALIQAGEANPSDQLVVDQLKSVLAERQQEEAITARQGILETRAKAKQLVQGVERAGQTLAKLDARDEVELAEQVQAKLNDGSTNQVLLKLADAYKLDDPNSKMSQAIAERQALRQAEGTQASFNFFDEQPAQRTSTQPTNTPPQAPIITPASTTGAPNAVQERSPTEIPVQSTPNVGGEVGQGVPQSGQAPVASAPVQAAPVQAAPVQAEIPAAPIQTTPVQTTPVQTTPVQATQGQTEAQVTPQTPQVAPVKSNIEKMKEIKARQKTEKLAREPLKNVAAATPEILTARLNNVAQQQNAIQQKLEELETTRTTNIQKVTAQQEAGKLTPRQAEQKIKNIESRVEKMRNTLSQEAGPLLTEAKTLQTELQNRVQPQQTQQIQQTQQTAVQPPQTSQQQTPVKKSEPRAFWSGNAEKRNFDERGVTKVLQKWMTLLGLTETPLRFFTHQDVLRNPENFSARDIDAARRMRSGELLGKALYDTEGKPFGVLVNHKYLGSRPKLLEILAHEIGHLHQRASFDRLSPAEQQELRDAYEADKAQVLRDGKYGTYLRLFVPYSMAISKGFSGKLDPKILNMPIEEALQTTREGLDRYTLSFNEWFAHQVARAATLDQSTRDFVNQAAQEEKQKGFVSNFFTNLARQLRTLYDSAKKAGYLPNTTFQKYLDNLYKLNVEQGGFTPNASTQVDELRTIPGIKNTQDLLEKSPQVVKPIYNAYRSYLRPTLKNEALHFSTLGAIRDWGKYYFGKAIDKLYPATEDVSVIEGAVSKLMLRAYNKLLEYEQKNPKSKAAELLGRLMEATNYQLDVDKTFDQHTWLKKAPNKERLREIHAEMVQIKNQLRQMGAYDIYTDMVAGNQAIFYMPQVLAIYNAIRLDPNAKAYFANMKDPWTEFTNDVDSQRSLIAARDFWKAKSKELYEKGNAYLKSVEKTDQTASSKRILSNLSALLVEAKKGHESLNKFPYFHLGRFGNHEVRFTVRKKDNVADPEALERIAELLDKNGFGGLATVSSDQTNPAVYIRLETEAQKENLLRLARTTMTAEKLLDPDKDVIGGTRGTDSQFGNVKKGAIDELIKFLKSNLDSENLEGLTDDQKAAVKANEDKTIADIVAFYRDSLSEFSQERVLLRRKYVGGYSPDMVRSYAYRFRVASQTVAHMVTMPRINEAFTDMRTQLREARADMNDVNGERAADMERIYNELLLRERLRPSRFRPSWIDRVRAYNHIYFLGLSPAYAMINLSQIPVLLWPELAKDGRVSFKKAAQTIFRVTPMAFKILRAAMQQERARGRGAEVVLSIEALEAAGLDPETTKFMIQMINTNSLDIGGASREHSQLVEGDINSKERAVIQWAGAFGYYTEAFNRVVAALAAKEVYNPNNVQKLSREEFAHNVVAKSMLQYAEWNVARAFGRNGIVGDATRLSATFMQYPMQVLERLTREMYEAFANDPTLTPQQQKERQQGARRFLAAHTTALLAFAGVVGLPFAGAIARAIEALADIFGDDDEPYDAMKSLNDFFSDLFGEDVAPYIMRGAIPRLAGTDIAERAGEGDILPFTKFMKDRRDWTEKSKDFAFESFGAPYSMAANILQGGQKLLNGDWIGAGEQALPISFRSLLKAGRYYSEGKYTDKSNNALPMTPGASAIMNQVLGFKPAELSDYQVQNRSDTIRRTVMQSDANRLRQDAYKAIEGGDQEATNEALAAILAWDEKNPAFAIGPTLGKSLKQRARARALSEMTGAPLNTPKRELLQYYLPKLTLESP